MEGGDADVLMEYVEFLIFPSQGRYEARICYGNKVEAASSGLLEQLVLHSPKIKSLYSKGSDASFKFKPLGNLSDAKWFTKSTLIRFLRIISSSDIINTAKAIVNEISQLEDARKFHVSLYTKGPQDHVGSGAAADGSNSNNAASTLNVDDNPTSSDASKNELLRALDLRLTALTGELAAVFDQAVGTKFSLEDITNVEKFSYYFGAVDLRNCLQKFVALRQENTTGDFPGKEPSLPKNDVSNDKSGLEGGNSQISRQSKSDAPVKYSASPAKAAQIERQNSSASESSSTSEEEQPSVERSRTLIRSASPRRSASPMRRVQIGRSGSRRSTALTIKSLNFVPARERSVSHKDESASDSDEEECVQTSKKSNNLQRISVQDAINLFERKQKVETVDFQKTKSLLNVSVANKAVLRRWSSGVCESSNPVNVASDDPASLPSNKLEDQKVESASEMKPECYPTLKSYDAEAADNDCKTNLPEERASSPEEVAKESLPNQSEETSQKLNSSAEWTRKKEAELNQLLMKMMETKPTKYQNLAPSDSKLQRLSDERRGGFYDHYKEKRDEKLRGETTRTQAEKENQFKALVRILDERKAEMVSRNASNENKKPNIKRTQKVVKKLPESSNPRNGTSKPAVVKKALSKTSPLPATRKSWPSAPSPRTSGVSPAKSPAGTTTPTRRVSQPAPAAPRSSQKVERLQPKTVRATENDTRKSVKNGNEKKHETLTKTSKPRRSKVQPASEDSASSAKPKLNKITKKSSVVPLESKEPKPFLRKGSGIGSAPGSGLSPVRKVKISSQPEECVRDSVDLVRMEDKEVAFVSSDPVNLVQDRDLQDLEVHEDKDFEAHITSPQKCENTQLFDKVPNDTGDFGRIEDSTPQTKVEGEPNISPSAWVEIEEHEDQSLPNNGDFSNNESLADVALVRVSSPRVRHSLSQMLLEDNSETDTIDWGNAENPPTIVYQKDEPKGLKRLLKFARKSKTDANSTGFSSPSVFSEGEDDPEDSKILTKRSSDNLLKKATLHAKNAGQQKPPSSEVYELSAPTSIGKITAQKLEESHISASVTTTKATRSFFSLSAFKGTKQNDAKLR